MAVEVQNLVTSINRLPGGVVQALLGILGVPRQNAIAATGQVRIDGTRPSDLAIPTGTRFYLPGATATAPVTVATTRPVSLSRRRQITSLRRTSTTVTAVTDGLHGFSVGQTLASVVVDDALTALAPLEKANPVVLAVGNEGTSFTYASATSGTIAATDTSGTVTYAQVADAIDPYGFVPVVALIPGYAFIAKGTTLGLLSRSLEISSVRLATDLDGGLDAETDAMYFQRASAVLGRMTSALVTADQIAQYVASMPEFGYVYRVRAINNCTAERVVDAPGSALVVVAKLGATNSVQIAESALTAITDAIDPLTHPALAVAADNAQLLYVDAAVTVVPEAGFTSTQVEAACADVLRAFFDPNTWNFENIVHHSLVASALSNVEIDGRRAVQYVTSIALTVSDGNFASLLNVIGATSFTGAVRSGDDLTINVEGAPPGAASGNLHYIAVSELDSDVWTVHPVTSTTYDGIADTGTFTLTQSNLGAAYTDGTWAVVAIDHATGQLGDTLELADPAPLLRLGSANITIGS